MIAQLGTLKRVVIREVWKFEDSDFTPWLAQSENIARLAAAIGMELEVTGVEVPVGPFSADILAKSSSGEFIIIENQFGKTDHDHLGKVLTYAATLNASAVVWIAERFTDEHRKAIEWLNDHTSNDLSLFAVELQLWRIDESRPAVQFNVLSEPSEIVRQATAVRDAGPVSEARQLQGEFWTGFREVLLTKKIVGSAQAARPQYWFNVALGRANVHLSNIASVADSRIGVRVYISNRIASEALPQLEAQKAEIETEIGSSLKWNPNPNAIDKVIVLDRAADLADRTKWPEYFEWLCEQVSRFKKAFEPRIRQLKYPQLDEASDSAGL
ncbi:DUF4268 domain-containing protein [Bradyrhizobium sp. Bra64]|uniref:DUF4268 domain-containing protein n=1 Tax=Bradyrhizobium sp. Bra64 TaxID=2926009 RepID=UPI0021177B79|nr:DUF4268 domain-containing protein [Bradyrhizobium sp. Bra64]